MPRRRELPDSLSGLIAEQAGVASRRQLLDLGLTRAQIDHRVRSGRWCEPLPRAILLSPNEPAALQRAHLAVAWSGGRGLLSGPTAAALGGLRGYEVSAVHLLLRHGRTSSTPSPAPWLVLHRTRRLDPSQIAGSCAPPRLAVSRAVVETAAMRRTPNDSVAVLAAAVQQRLTTAEALTAAVQTFYQLPYKVQMLDALKDIAGGSHSLPERDLMKICRRFGLPLPTRQAVRSVNGRRRYLDAHWERYGICVEIDGRAHMDHRQWVDDADRANGLANQGLLILRFPSSVVRLEAWKVARDLRAALISRGWRPATS